MQCDVYVAKEETQKGSTHHGAYVQIQWSTGGLPETSTDRKWETKGGQWPSAWRSGVTKRQRKARHLKSSIRAKRRGIYKYAA